MDNRPGIDILGERSDKNSGGAHCFFRELRRRNGQIQRITFVFTSSRMMASKSARDMAP